MPTKDPPRYDSRGEISGYLRQFQLLATLNGWDYYVCGLQLATFLVSDAREILSTILPEVAADYDSLRSALLHCYSSEGQETSYSVA